MAAFTPAELNQCWFLTKLNGWSEEAPWGSDWPKLTIHPALVYPPTLCICLTYKNITVHNLPFKVTKVGSVVSRGQAGFFMYTCVQSLKHMFCWILYINTVIFQPSSKKHLILPYQSMGFLSDSVNYKWLYLMGGLQYMYRIQLSAIRLKTWLVSVNASLWLVVEWIRCIICLHFSAEHKQLYGYS